MDDFECEEMEFWTDYDHAMMSQHKENHSRGQNMGSTSNSGMKPMGWVLLIAGIFLWIYIHSHGG